MLKERWDSFSQYDKSTRLQVLSAKDIIEDLIAQGIKQEVIAIEANINQSTVSRILAGKHKRVRAATLIKLDRARKKGAGVLSVA